MPGQWRGRVLQGSLGFSWILQASSRTEGGVRIAGQASAVPVSLEFHCVFNPSGTSSSVTFLSDLRRTQRADPQQACDRTASRSTQSTETQRVTTESPHQSVTAPDQIRVPQPHTRVSQPAPNNNKKRMKKTCFASLMG